MATWDLYVDTSNNRLVVSASNATDADAPLLVQGDTQTWRIRLLKSTGAQVGTLFSVIDTTGISLQVAIGTRVGNSSTYYTQQFTWTAGGTTADPYWEATMPLNTAAITTLLGSNSSAQAYLEIKYYQGGVPTTVLDKLVTIGAAVIKDAGTPTVPAGLTACSVEYANATFLTRQVTGHLVLVNPDTGAKVALYVDSSGQFHVDPMS